MLDQLIAPAKDRLRAPYRELRRKLMRRFQGFNAVQLVAALRECGIEPGSAICLHSGMSGFAGFHGAVADIVRAFQQAVGEAGTLLMPAFSFTGSVLEYAHSGAVFDPRRTPSQTGLISEIFRRFPNVQRSLHPTHSLCVYGARTSDWIATHLEADTPCGRRSPFEYFAGQDVNIVFAGANPATLTYFHFIEEVLEPQMPFSPFTAERFSLPYRANGEIRQSPPMRLYAPEISRRRTLAPLFTELQRRDQWKTRRCGTLELVVLRARDVLEASRTLAGGGIFCYR